MAIKSEITKLEKQLKLYKSVEKDNAKFNKMSKAQKRITIAQDVIDSLRIGKYVATPGNYFGLDTDIDSDNLPQDSQALLRHSEVHCDVCAIGAIFASKVRTGNKCNITLIDHNSPSDDSLIENLKNIFNENELRIIETAFEGEAQTLLISETDENKAINWHDENHPHNETKRLTAIMKNIIKNKGNFVP